MEMIVTILTYWFYASMAASPVMMLFFSGAKKLNEAYDKQGGEV